MDEETSLQMDEEELNKLNEVIVEEVTVMEEVMKEVTECMRTPRPTLYEQNETPGGSIYWEPHVEGIPVEGTYYGTIDEALDMYTKYAEMAGFEVKKGGQRKTKSGAVQHKYIYCNKEGVPKGININTLDPEYNKQKRNTTTHATGCKAHIRLVLDIVSGKYKLESFKPKHNHMLIPKEYKHFTKKQRKMNQSEKMFVVKAATNKIGATRAHNLYCSMKGGYEYVHGTSDDFKNHQRDVNQFIGESDAQMLINKMENRKNYVPNFTFQYKVDNSELVAMFWADEVAKCNYKEFGDIVSFDATFNNNKDSSRISCDSTESHQISLVIPFESYEISLESHVILVESQEILLESHVILLNLIRFLLYNMKFVPFIGIDNHEKCVTLGSGMLLHEDTQSYTWLLTAFMSAFLKEPTMIVTDQDGAMKRAIEAVFKKSKHRLCMWHIMQKIPFKICKEIYNETDFKEHFDKIVWNMFIEPLAFEEKWAQLIEDFDLKKHKWLIKMSESENSFFKSFTSPGVTLVCFMMSYESAMERQSSNNILITCVFVRKNREINVIPKQYILRRWTRDIIPPDLRRQKNRYGEKNVTIERLTNEANFLVDDCFVSVDKDEGKMGTYVENLKKTLGLLKADMPNPPSRDTGDVIEGIFSITKTNEIEVQNPTKAVNKGEHLKKGERLKSEREKAITGAKKKVRPCGFCKVKTNEHTKTTCPLNPKARKKRKASPVTDV
ncbi:FAR1-related sequence 5-like protein [Tanacetum coccineum]